MLDAYKIIIYDPAGKITRGEGGAMKVITIASLKGGVGKTTCAVFLSQALEGLGARVLAVDLDPCPNLTDYFLRKNDINEIVDRNVRHVLIGSLRAPEAIYHTSRNVDVIPSTIYLHTVSIELAQDPGAIMRFPSAIKKLSYDYVVIDTPPYLCAELRAALYPAHQVIVPVDQDRWTVGGYALLSQEMTLVKKTIHTSARFNVLPNRVSQKQCEQLSAMPGWSPLKAAILRNAAVKNAANRAIPLKPETQSFEQFVFLAREIQEAGI